MKITKGGDSFQRLGIREEKKKEKGFKDQPLCPDIFFLVKGKVVTTPKKIFTDCIAIDTEVKKTVTVESKVSEWVHPVVNWLHSPGIGEGPELETQAGKVQQMLLPQLTLKPLGHSWVRWLSHPSNKLLIN